jgi:HK97 family phage major capsid protein
MTFGQRALTPHPLTKGLKVSTRLLRTSEGRAEAIVANRIAYKLAVPMERAYMVGTGAGQALGLFTASARASARGATSRPAAPRRP